MSKLLLSCCKSKLWQKEKCICKEIRTINNFVKKCNKIYKCLDTIYYNKININYYDINAFILSIRATNDNNNKMRENIIGAIINNNIPTTYYKYSLRWSNLRNQIYAFIEKLCKEKNIINNTQKCIHKAGRNNHYDFIIILNNDIHYNVELKFNANCIDETPQFVSPMKPSQYIENSYEEYYYTNYLTKLVQEYNLSLPDKNEYLNKIHSNKPKCVSELQNKYYSGCKSSSQYSGNTEDIEFYQRCKELSKQSITNFITNNQLKINELTKYLLETQNNKYYMLYKNGNINLQTTNTTNYEIVSYKKEPELQSYIATTKTGITLKILLRWKNGNGIAFSGFQIS
jgi:hypothetical protein